MKVAAILAVAALLGSVAAQPFAPGQGVGPLGGFTTSDRDGPYNITLLSVQANEVAAGGAARQNFTDLDIIHFLTNVECLEGQFDTYGAFGRGFVGNLALGGPMPIGAQQANLSATNLPYAQEVALNEQGHALFTRHAGSNLPCPTIDITGGFNGFFALAYNLTGTVEQQFGAPFNPFRSDAEFFLSVVTLEELGATGNKGLAGITSNPVLANGISGLATSATAQATIERFVLWNLRDQIVQPFGETVTQVFARVSALRDLLDGPVQDDQGLVNTDPRTIAVPAGYINLIPTDIQGLTFSRTPQQIINIVTLGNGTRGGFFPNGLLGNINSSAGYTNLGNGYAPAPSGLVGQASANAVGQIQPPINGSTPYTVPGIYALTQSETNQRENASYLTRGYVSYPPVAAYGPAPTQVEVALPVLSSGVPTAATTGR